MSSNLPAVAEGSGQASWVCVLEQSLSNMASSCSEIVGSSTELWSRAVKHGFLDQCASGTVAKVHFDAWLAQVRDLRKCPGLWTAHAHQQHRHAQLHLCSSRDVWGVRHSHFESAPPRPAGSSFCDCLHAVPCAPARSGAVGAL